MGGNNRARMHCQLSMMHMPGMPRARCMLCVRCVLHAQSLHGMPCMLRALPTLHDAQAAYALPAARARVPRMLRVPCTVYLRCQLLMLRMPWRAAQTMHAACDANNARFT